MEPDLKILLSLTPEEIIAWYRAKGLNLTFNWYDLWQSAHVQSFTVAKVLKLDLLQDIRNSWVDAQEAGLTFTQWRRRLEPKLKEMGWWGKVAAKDVPGYDDLPEEEKRKIDPDKIVQLGSAKRLKTIYDTNNNVAYNASRYNNQLANKNDRPFLQYIQIERPTKRMNHSLLHLKVFAFDDPIWDFIYPPNGWGCGCYVRSLKQRDLDNSGLSVSDGSEFMDLVSTFPEEWQYNPGKIMFSPNLDEYDSDFAKKYQQEIADLNYAKL